MLGLDGTGGPATLRITTEWRQPGPDVPVSIGGYGFFGRLIDAEGTAAEFTIGESYVAELPAGRYELEVWTAAQSDAMSVEIVPGGTPRVHRDVGPVEALCSTSVDLAAGEVVDLVYRATVAKCEIVDGS